MINSQAKSTACYLNYLINQPWLNADLSSAETFVIVGNLIIALVILRGDCLQ